MMERALPLAYEWTLSAPDVVYRILAGLFIGFAIGLTGVGGGVLVMPTLTKLFGFQPTLAIPTANFYAVLVKAHAGFEHWKLNTIRRRVAFWFLVGGVPTDIAATLFLSINKRMENPWIDVARLDHFLNYLIAGVMVLTGLIVIVNFISERKKTEDDYFKQGEAFDGRKKLIAIACGMAIGLLIGFTSIGGGVLVIPMLATFFALSPNNTVGTSVAISIFLAMISAVFFFSTADAPFVPSFITAGIMFVGAVPGVKVGSKLAVKIPPMVLKSIVVVLILVAIVGMLMDGEMGH